jgi:hypothetical protein
MHMNAKKRFTRMFTMFALAWLFTAICCPTGLFAGDVASLRSVTGPVDIMRGGALPAVPARNGEKVASGDMVRTKSGGFAEVVYMDGTVLRISERSRVDIGEHFSGKSPDSGGVRLARGKVQALVDLKNVKSSGTGPKKFEVRTPNAIAGVRGTDLIVSHQRSTTGIFVRSGTVYSFNLNNPGRIVTLAPGMVTTVTGRGAPTPPRPALRQEIQRMEQGTTPPPSGSSSGGTSGGTGGAAAGGTGGTSGGTAGGAGGGTSAGGAGGAAGGTSAGAEPSGGAGGGAAAGGGTGGGTSAGAGTDTGAGGGTGTGGGTTAGAGGTSGTGAGAAGGTGGGGFSGGLSGGSSVFTAPDLPSLPTGGGVGASSGPGNSSILNRLATGGVSNVIAGNTTTQPATNAGGQVDTSASSAGSAPTLASAVQSSHPTTPTTTTTTTTTPTPTRTNVNVDINFKPAPVNKK